MRQPAGSARQPQAGMGRVLPHKLLHLAEAEDVHVRGLFPLQPGQAWHSFT